MTNRSRNLLVGVVAILALAPSMHGQNRNPVGGRPKPQKPLDVPPAVVVLQVDTSEGDSMRTIIQRDFDYGDRIQPLILDSVTLGDIWRPGEKRINFSPLAQTRANFLVRARPTTAGLHVEVYDVPQGRLRQEDYFRLPKRPPNRLPAIRDSLSGVLDEKAQATNEAIAADAAMRDSIAREAAKPVPLKTTRDRANARRAQAAHDSLSRELDRRDVLLRAAAVQDTIRVDSAFARFALKDSIVRDSLERERRLGIHVVSDEVSVFRMLHRGGRVRVKASVGPQWT